MQQNSIYILHDNITYKETLGEVIKLDIYEPRTIKYVKHPVVVYIHGGAWMYGEKSQVMDKDGFPPSYIINKSLLQAGVCVVSINYRLAIGTNKFPKPVEDCKDAIRWLRKNSDKYNLDIGKILVWGHSAGGHLSLMVGLTEDDAFIGDSALGNFSSRVNAVISYSGPTDLKSLEDSTENGHEAVINLLSGSSRDNMESYLKGSPTTYINNASIPLMLVHGEEDNTVRVEQSKLLYGMGKEYNISITLQTVENGDHCFKAEGLQSYMDEICKGSLQFIYKNLNITD